MNAVEKHLCEWVIENGTITRHESFDVDGGGISEQWTAVVDGETYDVTKFNGEWVYFFHHISRK